MNTKLKADNLRKYFRTPVINQNIHQLEGYDPAYEYKYVIDTYQNDPGRITRYLDAGWELVLSTEKTVDDRSPSDSDKESLRPNFVKVTTRDKHVQYLLRCHKSVREANEKAKKKKRDEDFAQMVARRGGSVERNGSEVKIRDGEVNENSRFD